MSRRHTSDEQNFANQKQNQEIRDTLQSLSGFEFSEKTVLCRPDLLAFALVLFHPAGQEVDGVSIPDDQLAFQVHYLVTGAFATLNRNPILTSEKDASFWKKVAQRLSGDDGDFPHIKAAQPIELSNILNFYASAVPNNIPDLDGDWIRCCSIMAIGAVAAWMCALAQLKSASKPVASEEPQHKRTQLNPEDTGGVDEAQTEVLKKVSKGLVSFWNRTTIMLHQANDKQLKLCLCEASDHQNASATISHQVSLAELEALLQEESDECRRGARVLITIYNYLAQGSQDTCPVQGSRAVHNTQTNSPFGYPESASELDSENGEFRSRETSQAIAIAAQDSPTQIPSDIQLHPSGAKIAVQGQRTCNGPSQHQNAIGTVIDHTARKRKHQETMEKFISRQSEVKNYPELCELQENINECSQQNALLVRELGQLKAKLSEAELLVKQKSEAARHKAQGEVVFLQQQLAQAVSSLRGVLTQQPGENPELLQEKYAICLNHMEALIARFEQVVWSGDLVDSAGDIELYLWRFGMDLKRTEDVALADLVDRLHNMAIYMSYRETFE